MTDIGNSSEFLGFSKMALLLTYVKGFVFMCRIDNVTTRGTVLMCFRYVSLPHKLVELEFMQFHSFVDQVSHNSKLDNSVVKEF